MSDDEFDIYPRGLDPNLWDDDDYITFKPPPPSDDHTQSPPPPSPEISPPPNLPSSMNSCDENDYSEWLRRRQFYDYMQFSNKKKTILVILIITCKILQVIFIIYHRHVSNKTQVIRIIIHNAIHHSQCTTTRTTQVQIHRLCVHHHGHE